jgi:hypothetical protein
MAGIRRNKTETKRNGLRRKGLRPVQVWLPDVNTPKFRSEAHRQSLAVALSEGENEDQNFIDAVSDPSGA